jgi:hypothetical protein
MDNWGEEIQELAQGRDSPQIRAVSAGPVLSRYREL